MKNNYMKLLGTFFGLKLNIVVPVKYSQIILWPHHGKHSAPSDI